MQVSHRKFNSKNFQNKRNELPSTPESHCTQTLKDTCRYFKSSAREKLCKLYFEIPSINGSYEYGRDVLCPLAPQSYRSQTANVLTAGSPALVSVINLIQLNTRRASFLGRTWIAMSKTESKAAVEMTQAVSSRATLLHPVQSSPASKLSFGPRWKTRCSDCRGGFRQCPMTWSPKISFHTFPWKRLFVLLSKLKVEFHARQF